jgi:hypothetical protein
MSDLFFGKRKTIFDILDESTDEEDIKVLKEAPEDEGDAGGGGEDAPADDTGGTDEADTGDNADDTAAGDEEDMGSDEDFDVDTSIDDDSTDSDTDSAGDDSMDTGGDLGGGGDIGGEEEVNPKNTNIFSTLTKEEQAIKIGELKKLFNSLYIYISDMLGKVNDINPDEDNLEAIYRVTSGLYDLKQNIGDYIKNIFPIKSYIENDVAYNRYLIIIKTITNVMNQVASEMEAKQQKDNKK